MMRIPFYGWFYRSLTRLAHKFDWHYAPVHGPREDGKYQRWCQWCGFRQSYTYDPRKPISGPLTPSPDCTPSAPPRSSPDRP